MNLKTERAKKIVLRSFLGLSALLLIYIIIRACNVDITHDEGVTYEIIKYKRALFSTSNNQWGNTIPEMVLTSLFGYSLFVLRLSNVLSFCVYSFFIYKTYQHFSKSWLAILLSFPVFMLNPFLTDFFSLSRGYGLAVAFFTGSLYWALRFTDKPTSLRSLYWSILFAVTSIYCNFSFVTCIFSLHASLFLYYLLKKHLTFRQVIKLGIYECALLIPAFINIWYLKKHGELYYAGQKNIIQDTLYSLIFHSTGERLSSAYIYIIIGVVFLMIILLWVFRQTEKHTLGLIVFISLLLIPTIQYYTLGVGYPLDRTALYWVVIFGLITLFTADEMVNIRYKELKLFFTAVIALFSLMNVLNFVQLINTQYVRFWFEDRRTTEILNYIYKDKHTERVKLGVTWYHFPAVNYYQQEQFHWLDSVFSYDTSRVYDYYLAPPDDTIVIPIKDKSILKKYPDIDALLYKNNATEKD